MTPNVLFIGPGGPIKFVTITDVLELFGEKMVTDLGNSLDRKKDASGALRDSIHFTIKVFSEHYQFNLLMEDYYKWVDEGRKPGKWAGKYPEQNPFNILKWISQKPGLNLKVSSLQVRGKNKAAKKVSALTDIAKAKSLAFLISRKIKLKGIKATHFFSNVFDDGRVQQLQNDLRKAMKKDITVQIQEIVKELK